MVLANNWAELGDFTGPSGLGVESATIDGDGHLILTMSDASEIDAGMARGLPGGGIDFESSVPTEANLPTDDEYGTARYVVDVGHLFVWEEDGGGVGVDGWTDVGPIRGEAGSDGTTGVDGVSITGATLVGGVLYLQRSQGADLTVGNVVGPAGADGADGAAGADGVSPIAYTTPLPPAATDYQVGQIAIGSNGKFMQAF